MLKKILSVLNGFVLSIQVMPYLCGAVDTLQVVYTAPILEHVIHDNALVVSLPSVLFVGQFQSKIQGADIPESMAELPLNYFASNNASSAVQVVRMAVYKAQEQSISLLKNRFQVLADDSPVYLCSIKSTLIRDNRLNRAQFHIVSITNFFINNEYPVDCPQDDLCKKKPNNELLHEIKRILTTLYEEPENCFDKLLYEGQGGIDSSIKLLCIPYRMSDLINSGESQTSYVLLILNKNSKFSECLSKLESVEYSDCYGREGGRVEGEDLEDDGGENTQEKPEENNKKKDQDDTVNNDNQAKLKPWSLERPSIIVHSMTDNEISITCCGCSAKVHMPNVFGFTTCFIHKHLNNKMSTEANKKCLQDEQGKTYALWLYLHKYGRNIQANNHELLANIRKILKDAKCFGEQIEFKNDNAAKEYITDFEKFFNLVPLEVSSATNNKEDQHPITESNITSSSEVEGASGGQSLSLCANNNKYPVAVAITAKHHTPDYNFPVTCTNAVSQEQKRGWFAKEKSSALHQVEQPSLQRSNRSSECVSSNEVLTMYRDAKYPQYIHNTDRRKSFGNWGYEHQQSASSLFSAGFFYTGEEDIVRCFYCNLGLSEFKIMCIPWQEHARYRPKCKFLIQEKGNDYIEEERKKWGKFYNPKYPEYEDDKARLDSYESGWNKDVEQTPEILSYAGFFYTGEADMVRCHFCGLRLKKWEPGDVPWVQHANWQPDCKFLIHRVGIDSINGIKSYIQQESESPKIEAAVRARQEAEAAVGVLQEAVIASEREIAQISQAIKQRLEDQRQLAKSNEVNTPQAQNMAQVPVKVKLISKDEAENQELKALIRCKKCSINDKGIVYTPCGHREYCNECHKMMDPNRKCGECQKEITSFVRFFLS